MKKHCKSVVVCAKKRRGFFSKSIALLMTACLGAAMILGGCGSSKEEAETTALGADVSASDSSKAASASETKTTESSKADEAGTDTEVSTGVTVRVGSLKGPTSMGLVKLMDRAAQGETANTYEFTMAGKADELVGKIASGDLDIVLVPANVASVLYNKTQGKVTALNINTLGVLYVVASDDSITSMTDLKGRTIYMTGKGTTPEYTMNYLLAENGLETSDVDLQFKSEATEVASFLKEDSSSIGVLPQPFATAACIQNDALKPVLDLTAEWDKLNQDTGSMLVTGATIVRTDFLAEHEEAVKSFLADHEASTAFTTENAQEAAELIAAQGIVEKAPIAKQALPKCNIVCITGQEMKNALTGYLSVLHNQDASSVGGELPGNDFYYIP